MSVVSPGSLSNLLPSTKTNHEPIAVQIFVHVTYFWGKRSWIQYGGRCGDVFRNRKEYCRDSNSCTWQFFITVISQLIVKLVKLYLRRIFLNKTSAESFVYNSNKSSNSYVICLYWNVQIKETVMEAMVILLRIEVLFLTSSTEVCFFEVHSVFFLLSRGDDVDDGCRP